MFVLHFLVFIILQIELEQAVITHLLRHLKITLHNLKYLTKFNNKGWG